jgi:hypothetical protein
MRLRTVRRYRFQGHDDSSTSATPRIVSEVNKAPDRLGNSAVGVADAEDR